MTSTEAKKIVAVLIAAFPDTKATLDTVAVYERMLADLDYPAANAAVERLIATSRYGMPRIAEIREAALTVDQGELRPGGDAWGEVLAAIGKYGYARQPGVDFQFDDPTTGAAVKAMNWRELCSSENPQADRARFIELYDKLAAARRRTQLSEHLPAMQRYRALQASREQVELSAGAAKLIAEVAAGTVPPTSRRTAWCAPCGSARLIDENGCLMCQERS